MFALPVSAIPEFAPPKPTRSTRAASLEEVVQEEEDEVVVAEAEPVEKEADEEPVEAPAAEADEVVVAIGPNLTLKQLKDMCSERGLPTHGKKSDLIERLR